MYLWVNRLTQIIIISSLSDSLEDRAIILGKVVIQAYKRGAICAVLQ